MLTRNCFQNLLNSRNYRGSLAFDTVNCKLYLKVDSQSAGEESRERDPLSLSGGEKSFATLCLLLTLWNVVPSAIRCIDEFDVFMDAINRKKSIQLLLEAAREEADTQHIFITPQDSSIFQPSPECKVCFD